MIPILYEKTETTFTSNGLGRLPDAISCTVTEERNGEYELLLEYPITGLHYADLELERIIFSKPAPNKAPQAFVIYQIEKPVNGIVTVRAEHISYRLNKMVVRPFTATTASAAMTQMETQIMGTHGFTFWTDRTTTANMNLTEPAIVREALGGMEGSILDIYGGEYEFDMFTVKLWSARGADNGVQIRYGKNITGINQENAFDECYTGIVPYWTDADGNCVYGNIVTSHASMYACQKTVLLDLSSEFEEEPTTAQLEARAASYLASNTPWVPHENIAVEMVPTEDVNLCDIVHVYFEPLNITVTAKVIRTVYDVVSDRYAEIEVGNAQRSNLSKSIDTILEPIAEEIKNNKASTMSWTAAAIAHATTLISGGLGGHVVLKTNGDGQPEEILIMDTDDIDTAQSVWRWNINGLGYSANGYSGPYSTAITMDGQIVADFITTGTLSANRISGGTLSLGGLNNESGTLIVYDAAGTQIGSWDNTGANITGDLIIRQTGYETSGKIITQIGTSDVEARIDVFGKEINTIQGLQIKSVDNRWNEVLTLVPAINMSVNGRTRSFILSSGNLTIATGNSYNNGYIIMEMGDGTNGDIFRLLNMASRSQGMEVELNESMFSVSQIDDQHVAGGTIFYAKRGTSYTDRGMYIDGYLTTYGNIRAYGSKNRVATSENYGERLLYCYETPSPYFGDIGEGQISEDGVCYVWLDPILAEHIVTEQYQVMLQAYGNGACYVAERKGSYFVVSGTPGMLFGWELKAKQAGYDQERLNRTDSYEIEAENYGASAAAHIKELRKQREGIAQ